MECLGISPADSPYQQEIVKGVEGLRTKNFLNARIAFNEALKLSQGDVNSLNQVRALMGIQQSYKQEPKNYENCGAKINDVFGTLSDDQRATAIQCYRAFYNLAAGQ